MQQWHYTYLILSVLFSVNYHFQLIYRKLNNHRDKQQNCSNGMLSIDCSLAPKQNEKKNVFLALAVLVEY